MNFKWIRPAMKPPRPPDVGELSAAAMEVLEALERRFQPASASTFGRPDNRRQPPPFFGGARRVSTQPQSQRVWGSSCGPVPSSGPNLSSQQVPHHRQPAFLDETSMGELSGIMRENVVEISTQRFNNSPLQNTPTTMIPYAEANDSSPMSSFDELLGIGPMDSFMPAGELYPRPVSERGGDCTERGAATGTDVFNDSNVFSPQKNLETDDVLNDSNLSSPLRNTETDDIVVLNDSNLSSPLRNPETDDIHLSDPLSSDISLNSNEEFSSTNINLSSQVHLSTSFELLHPNQFNELELTMPFRPLKRTDIQDGNSAPEESKSPLLFSRSCSPNEELARSANRSPSPIRSLEKSISMLSGSSFDDSIEIEGPQVLSEDDLNCKPRVLSPNIPSKQSPFRLNTPRSKVRKFLGTPFKRALSSTCIFKEKSNEIPEVEESQEKENCEPALNSRKSDDQDLSFDVQKQLECNTASAAKPADHTFASPFAKTPTDPRPVSYFPIFNSTHSKRKACDDTDKLRAVSSASCKKKLKFLVPYKKPESQESPSTHQKIQELAAKFAKQMNDKKQFKVLSETLSIDIGSKLLQTPPQETSVTVQYRGGFCQLNRPKTCTAHVPVSILLRVAWSSDVQYLSVLLEKNTWAVSFLKTLFSGKSRKICFEAQELIQLLVDKFGFNINEVSSQWLILDPLVGCWLLKPDEPPHSFNEISAFLQLTRDCQGPEMLLSKLSHCAEILYEKLTKNGLWKIFLHIEMRITPILACMELQGILVNLNKLREMEIILKNRLETVQAAAYEAAGMRFQLTSPQQLSAILYEQLKLDKKFNISVKETDKHHKSTSEAELIKFKDYHPLPRLVLEFRSLHKHKTTYVDALLGHIADNRIFVTWDQTSAATGRITSNEPNIQSIPKQPLLPEVAVRTAFIARPGFSFLAADFQHIELRVFAHLSKDTVLIRTLSQDIDVFKVLSQQWLQIQNIDEVSEDNRDKTKRLVYALMYGAGPSKLVEILQVDHNQASLILQKFSGAFPKMQDFTKNTLEKCRKQGYLATEAGRRRWFPHITSPNFHQRMHSERQAVNFLIQGTAADLCKCAMVHTQKSISALDTPKTGPAAHLLLQIHDELLWEVPDSNLPVVTDIVQEAMEGATAVMQSLSSFSVPLPVVMKVGKTWGDMMVVRNVSLGPSQQP